MKTRARPSAKSRWQRWALFGLVIGAMVPRSLACIKSDSEVLDGKRCPCADDLGYHCQPDGICRMCNPGEVYCGIKCTDLQTDPSNCGACGTECTVSNGTGTCVEGQCVVALCETGRVQCDGGRVCLNQPDIHHCGSCTNDCLEQYPSGGLCGGRACMCGSDPADCLPGLCVDTDGGRRCRCETGAAVCALGETCTTAVDGTGICSCNGGDPCGPEFRACCQNPAGCRTLTEDDSCNACGRRCPDGFLCVLSPSGVPTCACSNDSACNAGDDGAKCNSEMVPHCQCSDGTACPGGQRCFIGGSCG